MNLKLLRTKMDSSLGNPYFMSNPYSEIHWMSRRLRIFVTWCIKERLHFWLVWIDHRVPDSKSNYDFQGEKNEFFG